MDVLVSQTEFWQFWFYFSVAQTRSTIRVRWTNLSDASNLIYVRSFYDSIHHEREIEKLFDNLSTFLALIFKMFAHIPCLYDNSLLAVATKLKHLKVTSHSSTFYQNPMYTTAVQEIVLKHLKFQSDVSVEFQESFVRHVVKDRYMFAFSTFFFHTSWTNRLTQDSKTTFNEKLKKIMSILLPSFCYVNVLIRFVEHFRGSVSFKQFLEGVFCLLIYITKKYDHS